MNQHQRRIDEIRDTIPEEEFEALLEYPGATRYSFGFAEEGNQIVKDPSIIVWVEKKLPEEDLPNDAKIPEQLRGYRVDVKQEREALAETVGIRSDEFRPLHGSITCGSAGGGTCTLSATGYEDSSGNPIYITAGHCAGSVDSGVSEDELIGNDQIQPGNDGSAIGTVTDHGTFSSGTTGPGDYAIISLDTGIDATASSLAAFEFGEWEHPELGEWYVNNGQTSGYRWGICTDVGGPDSYFEFGRCGPDGWNGHSGSAWGRLDRNGVFHPVAIHTAGFSSWSGGGQPYEMINSRVTPTLSESPGQPTLTSAQESEQPYFEPFFREIGRDQNGDILFDLHIANTGGYGDPNNPQTETEVTLEDFDTGAVLDSVTLDVQPMEYETRTFGPVPAADIENAHIILRSVNTANSTEHKTDEADFGSGYFGDIRNAHAGVSASITNTQSITPGDTMTVEIDVNNPLTETMDDYIRLLIDGEGEVDRTTVSVAGGATETVTLQWNIPNDSNYNGTHTVTAESEDDTDVQTQDVIAGDNSISGTVTLPDDSPAQGATVHAVDTAMEYANTATTDSNGDYVVQNLGSGPFDVIFRADINGQKYTSVIAQDVSP